MPLLRLLEGAKSFECLLDDCLVSEMNGQAPNKTMIDG